MKKTIFILGLTGLIVLGGLYAKQKYYSLENANTEIKNGDLIFQASLSEQSKVIQSATKSKY